MSASTGRGAHGLDSILSSAGQLLLLFAAFVLPGFIALFVMQCLVESRAQRAHFLWFLAATTQKQRLLATELIAWGRSHRGRFGSQVLEVVRDIGVGESLSEALAANADCGIRLTCCRFALRSRLARDVCDRSICEI